MQSMPDVSPDQVAPGAHHLVLRDVRAGATPGGLRALRRAVLRSCSTRTTRRSAIAAPEGRARSGLSARRRADRRLPGATSTRRSAELRPARVRRRGRRAARARPAPRAAAPGAASAWTSPTCCRPTRSTLRTAAAAAQVPATHPHRSLDRAPGWCGSGRPRADERIRVRQRGAAPRGAAAPLRDRRRLVDLRRVARVHRGRRLPTPGAVDVRRLGARSTTQGWDAPLYWRHDDGSVDRRSTSMGAMRSTPRAPWRNVSWYEADAFARWSRRPAAHRGRVGGRRARAARRRAPRPGRARADAAGESPDDPQQWFGELWQWTESAYRPYPGFRAASGAIGEYNGKFMVNQQVLRGSSCRHPTRPRPSHLPQLLPAGSRWMFSGVRLARDC